MKTIHIILGLLISSVSLSAQNYLRDISSIKKVVIHDLYGELKIDGSNPNELSIKRLSDYEMPEGIENYKPEKYYPDNTGLGLHISTLKDVLTVNVSNNPAQFSQYKIDLPKHVILSIENKFPSMGDDTDTGAADPVNGLTIKGMKNEIDINVFSANLKLNNIPGPLVASVYRGNCEVNFEKYNQENPSNISVVEGDITVNFQFSTNARVTLKSGIGDIKTNFVFREVSLEYADQVVQKKKFSGTLIDKNQYSYIEGKINKGGNSLTLSSLHGEVRFYQYGNPVFVTPVPATP